MDTSFLHIGPVGVYPLGLALGLSYLAAGAVGRPLAVRMGLAPMSWWSVVVGVMIVTVVGARLAYVLPDLGYYMRHPAHVWQPPIDGLSFYGGFLGGILYVGLSARRMRKSFWSVADLIALPYITGLLVICLLWSSPVYAQGAPTWAAALIDVVYFSGVYLLLWWLWVRHRSKDFSGQLFLVALGGDSFLRIALGVVGALLGPGDFAHVWLLYGVPAAVVVGALALLFLRGRQRSFALPMQVQPFQRPLSRWVVWLVVYGFFLSLLVALRALQGLWG